MSQDARLTICTPHQPSASRFFISSSSTRPENEPSRDSDSPTTAWLLWNARLRKKPGQKARGVAASVEKKWLNGWSAAATFEGEFSSVTASYAGKGVVRYAW
jgi:hypothetical protein